MSGSPNRSSSPARADDSLGRKRRLSSSSDHAPPAAGTLRDLEVPFPRCNWVDRQLCFGAAPWSKGEFDNVMRVVRPKVIVRLTRDDELRGVYQYWALERDLRARVLTLQPPHGGVAEDLAVKKLVDAMIEETRDGGVIWMHCIGGVGRSGTVAAIYLGMRDKLDAERAIELVEESYAWRRKKPNGPKRRCPETEDQRDQVRRLLRRECHSLLYFQGREFRCIHPPNHDAEVTPHRAEAGDAAEKSGVTLEWHGADRTCSWGEVADCHVLCIGRQGDTHRVRYVCPEHRCENGEQDGPDSRPGEHTASEIHICGGDAFQKLPDLRLDARAAHSAHGDITWRTIS